MSGVYEHKRIVSWGDCDPAGIIYTPRAFDFCTQAIEGWYRDVAGKTWSALLAARSGSPMVHAECDYLKPLPPDTEIVVRVRIEKLGGSTITFGLDGLGTTDQAAYFRGRFVACISDLTRGKAMRIPAPLRALCEEYQARQDSGQG